MPWGRRSLALRTSVDVLANVSIDSFPMNLALKQFFGPADSKMAGKRIVVMKLHELLAHGRLCWHVHATIPQQKAIGSNAPSLIKIGSSLLHGGLDPLHPRVVILNLLEQIR